MIREYFVTIISNIIVILVFVGITYWIGWTVAVIVLLAIISNHLYGIHKLLNKLVSEKKP